MNANSGQYLYQRRCPISLPASPGRLTSRRKLVSPFVLPKETSQKVGLPLILTNLTFVL